MKITRKQLKKLIKEVVTIPVPESDSIYMSIDLIDDATERIRGVLKSTSHEDIAYSDRSVGTGPERIDKALQKELGNIKRLIDVLERKLTEKGMVGE